MAHVCVPDSLPLESQYAFEATQLSQPQFSQTQNTQYINSQVEPRRKYWATLIPINPQHRILKIPWTRPVLQIGRGPPGPTGNDVVLLEKRVSNKHCRISLGIDGIDGQGPVGDDEPDVWIEDLKSSNGSYVNGERLKTRKLLRHGDEISLGHAGSLENHDVRYIFRSVGGKGAQYGKSDGKIDKVGEVYEKYQFLDVLGSGTFAEVRKAVDVETGDLRAIKQIVKHRFASNPKTLELFRREIDISQSLQHENICRLIEAFEDPQHVCLVLEYVDGGDLLDHIMNFENPNGGGFPEDYACSLTLQICRAMAYTHRMGVTHRDLKPENILLTKETPNTPRQIKIADFGLAKMVHSGTMLVSMVGTPQYLAPEVVMQTNAKPGYENVVDSWSVGIIVYSMLTKALPFDEDEELPVDKRIKARFHQQADFVLLRQLQASSVAIDFIGNLLAKDPAGRMTMAEALEHPWLSEPASQESESQRYPLGGDSVFEIESFDENYFPDNNESYNTGDWSRPMTASGTNLESGMGGLQPGASSESADDFSQPLQQLKLRSSIGNMPSKLGMGHNSSPPSPPLTDEAMQSPDRKSQTPPPPPVESAVVQNGESSLLTPNESFEAADPDVDGGDKTDPPGTAAKRKARDLDPFSSGSLSPPPTENIELSSPDDKLRANGTSPPSTENIPAESVMLARGGMRTTRSSVKANAKTTPPTRGRKSMRIR